MNDQKQQQTGIRKEVLAGLLVFLGAICFSAKAVLVKLAYRYEVDSVSLLTLRMVFSLPVFLLVAWWVSRSRTSRAQPLNRRDWFYILLFGIAGYYLASILDFIGLQYITASMERLILFIYPTMVLVLSALFLGKPIRREQYLALGLTYVGIALAFAQGMSLSGQSDFVKGAIFIFFGAFSYAIYLIGSGNLLPRLGTWRYTSLAMSAACGAVIIHHGILYQWQLFHFPAPVYWLAFLMAMLSTVLPAFLVSEGIRVIGSGNASIIGSVGPISTIVLAYIFLGERLGGLQWLGTGLVISGVILITLYKRER